MSATNCQPPDSQDSVIGSGLSSSTTTSRTTIEAWLERTSQTPVPLFHQNPRKRRFSESSWTLPSTPPRCQFLGDMADSGNNGGRSLLTPSSETTSPDPSLSSTIDSKSTYSTEPKLPKDAHWIGRRLESHGLYKNKPEALDAFPKFEKLVRRITDRKRESIVKPSSAKKLRQVHDYYEGANEATFLSTILPTIIKPSRTGKSGVRGNVRELDEDLHDEAQAQTQVEEKQDPKQYPRGIDATDKKELTVTKGMEADNDGQRLAQDEAEYGIQDYWDDGLGVKIDCEFRRGFLPDINKDTDLAKAMAKVDGMINPKPDITYGVRLNHYPIPSDVTVSAQTDLLLEVVPLLHFPFFIIEGKLDSGSKAEAENQARRGGATLINVARLLLERIGMQEKEIGPDRRTYIFSATLSPGLMDFWVHWAEVRNRAPPIFHMHFLESVATRNTGAASKLRKITHNILDWGCVDRTPEIQDIYNRIFTYEKASEEDRRKQLPMRTPNKKRKVNDGTVFP